jgi:hypothetical protein
MASVEEGRMAVATRAARKEALAMNFMMKDDRR